MRRIILTLILLSTTLYGLACSSRPEPLVKNPKLVLYIVVDQFPESYFDRFGPMLHGGLARLRKEGRSFSNASFSYATTNTCPGHATVVTGANPEVHGVIDNNWYDRKHKEYRYCVEGSGGISPEALRMSTISDWLKAGYPAAKVYSISAKDRSAAMLGGKNADAAFWFDDESGRFESSDYYPDHDAWWLENFNKRKLAQQYFGALWQALPVAEAAVQRAGIQNLDQGVFPDVFPHAIGKARMIPDSEFFKAFERTPFIDEVTAKLAEQIIIAERLGKDDSPDFLAIGFSALDRVGHTYGPHSPEVLDTVLRLDRTLSTLFHAIDRHIGLEHVLIAFSSDHGVQPLPELRRLSGAHAHRLDPEDIACVQQFAAEEFKGIPFSQLFEFDFYLDREKLKALGISRKELDERVLTAAKRCSFVERLYSSAQLHTDAADSIAAAFARGYDPERSPDYLVQLKEYTLPEEGRGTGHGTPYRYDTHVPLIIAYPPLKQGSVDTPVDVIDLSVTIAKLLGLDVPSEAQGRSLLAEVLR